MKAAIFLFSLFALLALEANARGKVSHSLGKQYKLKSSKTLLDGRRRLNLPRFQQIIGDIARALLPYPPMQQGVYQNPAAAYNPYAPSVAGAYNPYAPQLNAVAATSPVTETNVTELVGPDLEQLETDQNATEELLEKSEKQGEKLKLALDQLTSSLGVNERKGIKFQTDVVNPAEAEEAEIMKAFEAAAAPRTQYTAPVIVLLPSEPTPRDKLEFSRAIALKGAAAKTNPELVKEEEKEEKEEEEKEEKEEKEEEEEKAENEEKEAEEEAEEELEKEAPKKKSLGKKIRSLFKRNKHKA